MGQARRLRQAKSGCAGENDFNGLFQCAPVADRDEKRLDVGARSQNSADYFLVVLQQGKATFLKRRFCEAADKSAFCAADCWSVEEKAQMSGYT